MAPDGRISNKFDEILISKGKKDQKQLQIDCFRHFDENRDGVLNLTEFSNLCSNLFCNAELVSYTFEAKHISEMFYIFDRNKDGKIDSEEFEFCWKNWIANVLWPVSCLLCVDIQNDFISGSLSLKTCPAGEDGAEVVPIVNKLISSIPFNNVMYSLDWHPSNHISFINNIKLRKVDASSKVSADDAKLFDSVIFEGPPQVEQIMWPEHCVQNSWGSELHKELKIAEKSVLIYKGVHPNIDSYSAFWDNSKLSQTTLNQELASRNVTDVYVCGLAYDVCVGATAIDSLEMGFRTILIEDASRGVVADDIIKTKEHLCCQDAVVVSSSQVKAMVSGHDRKPELAYRAALLLADK